MASYYWAKVYIEILDDAKMGRLSDRLWRRTIELILIAKDTDKDGDLPSLDDMAWRLRTNAELLEAELTDLARVGIVENRVSGWHVANFNKRQDAMTSADRTARHRERVKSQDYHETVTDTERNGNETVTNRYTDKIRIDKNRGDKIKKHDLPPLPVTVATPELMTAWGEWQQYHIDRGKALTFQTAKIQHQEFIDWGPERAVAAIKNSMGNNWTALVEPKGTGNSKRPTTLDNSMAAIKRALGD